jgi:uncharacterized repeat protein (TIGR03803 family)
MRSEKPCSTAKIAFAVFMTFLMAATIATQPAQAQKFKVLYKFQGAPKDGAFPHGIVIRDSEGNFYGTTASGGRGNCGNTGCGTAFKLDKDRKRAWLHSFDGVSGSDPMAGLLRDAMGNLYGTTTGGGKITSNCPGGCGLVFRLDSAGKETVLHRFKGGGADGQFPESLLVADASGNLYGTTYEGHGYGAVFKVTPADKETILHGFAGPPDGGRDGAFPYSGVIRDASGNIYGVTGYGGIYGGGAAYKVDVKGNESLLYSFGGSDGVSPVSVLVEDAAGNLYGTAAYGGNSECGGTGCGVVFELSPQSNGTWTEAVLYTFCSESNCADGEEPADGPLVRDKSGNLFGTTYFGGTSTNCDGAGCGVVFKLDAAGKETVLHDFTGGSDGAAPWAGLTVDAAGNLYGSTVFGGDLSCEPSYGGCGVVFEITP